ncbi:hypothetical protein [Levilactobacillus bambusae]|uniref:Lipoprotein n=1 Tax=Levilactobacillus bambusae TaxID=2024736 RepID=A0A2V1MZB6_9LACO|nr:hypothetical protein [Levilactobacillus bambusae]PWG00103.1 hypothetical protein DCM90_03990 [Levilactobacillus bambusae]
MKKAIGYLFGLASLTLLLAGCSSTKISTTKTSYAPEEMNAMVKGTTKAKTIRYTVDNGQSHKVTVSGGTFFFQVPATTKDQTVKITANSAEKTVTVKKAKALGNYKTIANKYNNAVIAMKMPEKTRNQLMDAQKNGAKTKAKLQALAKTDPAAAAQAAQEQKQAAATMQQAFNNAKKKANGELLPVTPQQGIHNAITQKNATVRLNVNGTKLMGITLITPNEALKTKSGKSEFGTTFALLGNALDAKPKTVMKKFETVMKDAKNSSSSTTTKTIYSNHIRFNTGFSASHLYIYMNK